MDQVEEKAYAYWLCGLPGAGNRTIEKLLRQYGTAREIYELGAAGLEAYLPPRYREEAAGYTAAWKPEEAWRKLEEDHITFLVKGDDGYPKRLQEIPDAPYGLFLKGKAPSEEMLSVAVVGARDCSEYGRYLARELGRAFGEHGIQVVSGMARGIDGICQMAALEAGGSSFGVLGCGVDICYPSQNRPLYRRLQEKGGILSIYPPGMQPRPSLFPPRNRIVSGLSDAVVVVEARQRSGTLITVDMALEQGREVYAVPGRLTDRLSDGCNRLLKQGAGVLLSPADFIAELKLLFPERVPEKYGQCGVEAGGKREDVCDQGRASCGKETADTMGEENAEMAASLSEEAAQVLSCLDLSPRSIQDICGCLPEEYSYGRTQRLLMQLCIAGAAVQVTNGYYRRNFIQHSH